MDEEVGGTYSVAINVLDQDGELIKKIELQVVLTSVKDAKITDDDTS